VAFVLYLVAAAAAQLFVVAENYLFAGFEFVPAIAGFDLLKIRPK
jgi:hypothetical protein